MRTKTEEAGRDEDRGGLPSLLQNISWLGSANLVVKPFWFLFITAACMRLMGVQEYGVMTAALSLAAIGTSFVDLGMTQYTIREVSRDPAAASRYFSNFMALRVMNSFGAWLAVAGTALILGYTASALAAVMLAAVYTLSQNLTNYCRAFYRAFEDLRQEAVMLVLEKVLVIGAGLLLLISTSSAAWTLAGMAGGMVVATVVNTALVGRHFAPFRLRTVNRNFIWKSARVMIPFGLAGLFTSIYYRVDLVMVEAFLGRAPTGQYGAAYRILEALNMLPAMISIAAMYPRLSKIPFVGEHDRYARLLRKSMFWLVGAAAIVSVVLTVGAPTLISLLDPDPTFEPAAGALRILVWSFPLFCANSLMYAALVTLDDQRFLAWTLATAVALNVALNLIAIPALGLTGAAVTTVGSEVILIAVYFSRYVSRRKHLLFGHP